MNQSAAVENPYVGPRPFQTGEGARFFGRDLEARELVALVASERLVLFYAQSGAGKSSLINARLLPTMEERGFAILPVGRVSGQGNAGKSPAFSAGHPPAFSAGHPPAFSAGHPPAFSAAPAGGKAPAKDAGAPTATAEARRAGAANIFIYNLILSLDGVGAGSSGGGKINPKMTLADYLASLPTETAAPVPAAAAAAPSASPNPIVESGLQPLLLVIDQFEEIFTTHPEAWRQREGFFIQLAEAMERDPSLWVVLTIREDYVAALDPYARLVPNHLRARYYMERMGYQAALEAVKKPAEALRPFDAEVAEKLVDNLRLVATGEVRDGAPLYVEGQYVEPVQLQVVCMQLWENLKDTPGSRISSAALNRLARGEDLAQYVSRALADFYEQSIARVLQDPSVQVAERDLRDWFAHELITEAGTRGFAFQGDEKTGSLPNAAVRLLESQFIVRSETRAGGKWYELVHDRFVAPISQANRRWRDAHSSPTAADAVAWQEAGRPADLLYEGKQLDAASAQLAAQPDSLSPVEQEFIRAGQEQAARTRARRQKRLLAVVIGITVLFAVLAGLALWSAYRAQKNAEFANLMSEISYNAAVTADAASVKALVEQENAVMARKAAETAQASAENEREVAQTAQAEAVIQRDLVAAEKKRTEAERQLAQAGQLAALSEYYRESKPDLARLLAVEAYRTEDSWVSRKALFNGLRGRESVTISRASGQLFNNQFDIYSLAFSPDGAQFATGRVNGTIDLWDTASQALAAKQPPAEFSGQLKMYALAFNPTGDLLAAGGEDRVILLWNRKTGKVSSYPGCRDGLLTHLAFQHKGTQLAATCTDGGAALLDTRTGNSTSINLPGFGAWSAAWLHDDARLAIGYTDGSIRIWNLGNLANPQVLRADRQYDLTYTVRSMALSKEGRYLYTADRAGHLRLWDLTSGELVRQSNPEETPDILSLAVSGDGQVLVTGNAFADQQTPLTVWDANTFRPKGTLTGHQHWVMAAAIDGQDNYLATAGLDGSVILWKLEGQTQIGKTLRKVDNVEAAALELDTAGLPLLVAKQGKGLGESSVPTGPFKATFTRAYSSLAVVPPRLAQANLPTTLALGGADGSITFYELASGQPVGKPIQGPAGVVTALAVQVNTLSATRLLTEGIVAAAACVKPGKESGCDENAIGLWNMTTGEAVAVPASETRLGKITSLALRPDGSTLAAGGQNGMVMLYGLRDGKLASGAQMQYRAQPVTSLAFSHGGELLASGMGGGTISLWDGDTYRLIGEITGDNRTPVVGLAFQMVMGQTPLVAAYRDGLIMEWNTAFDAWVGLNCQLAGRSMTPQEWAQFALPGAPYQETCP